MLARRASRRSAPPGRPPRSQEAAAVRDAFGGAQVEVDARVDAAVAEVAVERAPVAVAVDRAPGTRAGSRRALGGDADVLPAGPAELVAGSAGGGAPAPPRGWPTRASRRPGRCRSAWTGGSGSSCSAAMSCLACASASSRVSPPNSTSSQPPPSGRSAMPSGRRGASRGAGHDRVVEPFQADGPGGEHLGRRGRPARGDVGVAQHQRAPAPAGCPPGAASASSTITQVPSLPTSARATSKPFSGSSWSRL